MTVKKLIKIFGFALPAILLAIFINGAGAAGVSGNLLLDPSFENPSCHTGAGVPCWQSYTGGSSAAQGFSYSGDAHSGASSLSLMTTSNTQLAGAYQRIDLNQTAVEPVLLSAYVKGENITMAPNSWFGASLYAEIVLDNGTVVYWNSAPNSGTFDWREIGFNTLSIFDWNTGAPMVNRPISHIYVVPILAYASGLAYFDDVSAVEYTAGAGAVTLMFDDGADNTYYAAKPVLDKYGFVGSSAVISNQVGAAGFMNSGQLSGLEAAGWDIVSHSKSHGDLTKMTPAQITAELADSKTALESMGLTINDFAYPYGAYNGAITEATARYYRSGRAYERGDNPYGLNPFDVKVRSVENTTTLSELAGWLNRSKNEKRWTVLVFHAIADTSDDQYYTAPAALDAMLAAVKDSGLDVINYGEGIRRFAPSGAAGPDLPPSISIASPADSATVAGTVSVLAAASDDKGVVRVDFYLNGSLKASRTQSPYSWDWDTLSASNGTHVISAIAVDSSGQSASNSVTVTVNNTVNNSPIAAINVSNQNPRVGEIVTFNGSASSDDKGIVSYAWNFGDGATAGGVTANHAYAAAGVYTATLTVTDTDGATGAASVVITVTAEPAAEALSAAVSYTTDGGRRGDRNLIITLKVSDDQGRPVSGAQAAISVYRNGQGPVAKGAGQTNKLGQIVFKVRNARAGHYTTAVTDLRPPAGYSWDGSFTDGTDGNGFIKR